SRAAAVTSQRHVSFSQPGGDSGVRITGTLTAPAPLSVESARPPTPAGGTTRVLLVGGSNGLYRMITPTTIGFNLPWTKYGENLPNVPVSSVHYYSGADTLLVGTFGRGAWALANASATR